MYQHYDLGSIKLAFIAFSYIIEFRTSYIMGFIIIVLLLIVNAMSYTIASYTS